MEDWRCLPTVSAMLKCIMLLFWAYQSSSAVAPPKYATQCGKLRQKYAHASIPLGGDEKALEDEKERRERGK